MKKRSAAIAAAAVLLFATGTTLVIAGREPARASVPPAAAPARDVPPQVSRRVVGPREYQDLAEASFRPGTAAFRAYTDDYVDATGEEVAAHMARERLTLDETRELTNFAMLAKTSLDWDAVEVATGHPIHPNARKYAVDAMFEASEKMKGELRAEIAAGADEAARRATIERIEQEYLDRYFHLTGMDADLLDWMLWQYVQDHPEEMPDDLDGIGQPQPGAGSIDRGIVAPPPPPPPPPDSPPPGAPVPAPVD